MNNPALKESLISCRASQGVEIRGTVLRLSRHLAVFEVYSSAGVLQTSEVLSEFRIILLDRTLYSGRAVVRNLVSSSSMTMCEATLEDSWQDADLSVGLHDGRLVEEFRNFVEEWQKSYKIVPEYKVIVADMQSFLTDLRLWLEQVELGLRASPNDDRLQLEQRLALELGEPVIPMINALFDRFEAIAERLEDDTLAAYHGYMKRQLHPLVLCSPFAYRTFQKPLGYAGDYELVNMMAGNPCQGSTLYAKVVNLWFLRQPPAEAHRNRLTYLEQKLVEETARVASAGRAMRVFNAGCGPAIEVQRFVASQEIADRAQFTLMDFNEETIRHTAAALDEIKTRHGRETPLQFLKKSVQHILKESGRRVERPRDQCYDFIYCAGLFDYLPDQAGQRFMNVLYDWLAPGGLLVATNVERCNPLRNGMEHLLDWHLIYRSAQTLRTLKPAQAPADSVLVRADTTGVNLFLEVRKDGHAH